MDVCIVVLQVIQKLRDNNIYPTSLELLRVNLAATVFSPEVQDLLQQFKDDVKHALGLKNTDPLSTYMNHFWELLQLNNSKVPIKWTHAYGLDTVVWGNGRYTLNWLSKLHGVSIHFLTEKYPDLKAGDAIPCGKMIRFNKPKRWLAIAKWFREWEEWIQSLPDLTQTQKNRLFITHQLHTDLQRTCHAMHDMMYEYVSGNPNRRWVPHRFSQDPLESFFSEIRQSGGGNTDSCRNAVDRCVRKRRYKQKAKQNVL